MSFLTEDPIDLGCLLALVQSPARGGIASFLGIVRNHQSGRAVVGLDYSAYAPMAEAVSQEIVSEAESRWDVAVSLLHRIGKLSVGDTAVAVVAASAHRDDAFLACRYVIEQVKRRVPIWKKEYYADGSVMWVGSGEAREQARTADRI
ncbi:MAG TPA: molybdenum cofactor biosynthesis protein MoaE [Gemmatimonadales bacterium]|nr:molybdenum cofactor biosynthesis protein MoaE [Gemmatimonadales bacterium]